MAYTAGFTAVTGATFTAAQYNTNVRDNFSAVWVGTTAGDMDYYAGATSKNRLAIGAARKTMRVAAAGNAPEWRGTPITAVLYGAGGTLANGAYTSISFDTETIDTDALWAIGDPTKLNFPYAGIWSVSAFIAYDASATGYRALLLKYVGVWGSVTVGGAQVPAVNGDYTYLNVSAIVESDSSGDYVFTQGWQNSGAPLIIQAAKMQAAYLGAKNA